MPTPADIRREKREYLMTSSASTGGVQRFKAGNHGAKHNIGAMIGYIQADGISTWRGRIDAWIRAFVRARTPGWSTGDRLMLVRHDVSSRVAVLVSEHAREHGLPVIALRHLWIEI